MDYNAYIKLLGDRNELNGRISELESDLKKLLQLRDAMNEVINKQQF